MLAAHLKNTLLSSFDINQPEYVNLQKVQRRRTNQHENFYWRHSYSGNGRNRGGRILLLKIEFQIKPLLCYILCLSSYPQNDRLRLKVKVVWTFCKILFFYCFVGFVGFFLCFFLYLRILYFRTSVIKFTKTQQGFVIGV